MWNHIRRNGTTLHRFLKLLPLFLDIYCNSLCKLLAVTSSGFSLYRQLEMLVKPFHINLSFQYPLKASENLPFL